VIFMENDYVIREAGSRDFGALLGLLHQLSPPSAGEKLAGNGMLKQVLESIVANENIHLFVFESSGCLLGTGTLLVQLNLSHGGRPYAHIENLVVDEGSRKKGIGAKIACHLVERAKGFGCYKVILNCKRHNMPFYGATGFNGTGEVEMRLDL